MERQEDKSELMQFLLSIEIKEASGVNGVTVESQIQHVSGIIGDKAKYKFRVIGEAKIIAIFEVKNYSVVNEVTSGIISMGTGLCNVTCTTLTHFEKRQKGIRPNSVQNLLPATLSGNDVLWFEVAYDHGISHEEFDVLWERGTQSMLHQLSKIDMEIFKVLGERRLYGFTCKLPNEDWETHLWNFQAEDKIYKNVKLVMEI